MKAEELKLFHTHTQTGRPLGAEAWVKKLEAETGRKLRAKPPGRPKTVKRDG